MQTFSPQDVMAWLLEDSPISLHQFAGREGGFNENSDVVRAMDGTDLNDFWSEVQSTISIRNADRDDLVSQLSYRISGPQSEVTLPTEVDFEEASEYGQPVGIKGTLTRMFRGFDFKFYDLGIRYTRLALAEMDQQQLRMNHNLALEADRRLFFRKVMQRLFNPLNSNGFTDKNEPITVFAAYNGDGEVPPKYEQTTFNGSHNHYLVSGAAAVRSQDLDRLALETAHHGYTLQKGYRNVLLVNEQELAIIKTFKTATGAQYDFVPNPATYGGAVWVPNNGSYVGGPANPVQGEEGTYGPFHIVKNGYVPAGYLVSIVTGGSSNLGNPIGLREHANPTLRGLQIIPGQRSQYPLIDSFYQRGIGTGVAHRGGIALMQIKATGSYAIPAVYDAASQSAF